MDIIAANNKVFMFSSRGHPGKHDEHTSQSDKECIGEGASASLRNSVVAL